MLAFDALNDRSHACMMNDTDRSACPSSNNPVASLILGYMKDQYRTLHMNWPNCLHYFLLSENVWNYKIGTTMFYVAYRTLLVMFCVLKFYFMDFNGMVTSSPTWRLKMGDYINKAAKLWHGLFSNYLFKYHSKSTMSLHIIMCWSGLLKMVKPEIVWRILWIITPQNPLIYQIFYIHSVTWKSKGQKGCYTDYMYLNPFWS